MLQPVVIKLGERGQHQLALTATVGFALMGNGVLMERYGYTHLF